MEMKGDLKTAEAVARAYKETNPTHRFAFDEHNKLIACYEDSVNRFVSFISGSITGDWVSMPYEIKVNGKLPTTDWIEV
jgi:hypothetical protein